MRAWIPLVLLALAACGAPATRQREPREDCDGDGRPGPLRTWYADHDGDGYGQLADTVRACTRPAGYRWASAPDCDDTRQDVHPDATERCDGVDEDCDGVVDDHVPGKTPHYEDDDGDGWGGAPLGDCTSEGVTQGGDCDDFAADRHPGALWHPDVDADGFGDARRAVQGCEPPQGYTGDASDCDDDDAEIYPRTWYEDVDGDGVGAKTGPVSCEPVDGFATTGGDCDDGDPSVTAKHDVWQDYDDDGHGAPGAPVSLCHARGYSTVQDDCDDDDANVHPGALEWCNGTDDDCDGVVDEHDDTYWRDADGDGHGDPDSTTMGCALPWGYVDDASDCDDTMALIHPGATELCDGFDDDCDGLVDANDPDMAGDATWYPDEDGDGSGDPSGATVTACAAPPGYALTGDDCDDTDPSIRPGLDDPCGDNIDADCDGDDYCPIDDDVAVFGVGPDHRTGEAYATGDVDGDGIADLLVGDVRSTGLGRTAAGEAWLVSGTSMRTGLLSDVDAAELVGGASDGIGGIVALPGDLDGDGVGDLAIATGTTATTVYLVSGATAHGTVDVPTAAFARLTSATTGVQWGPLGAAGDLDGDGEADLWVGGAYWAPTSATRGSIAWARGPLSGTLASYAGTITTPSGWLAIGSAVATGDLDGDGREDVVTASGGVDENRIYVFTTAPSGDVPVSDADVRGSAGAMWLDDPTLDVDDFDGDGYADLVYGSTSASNGEVEVVRGPLSDGAADEAWLQITGGDERDMAEARAVGDLDGDAASELVVVGRPRSGYSRAWLFRGDQSGVVSFDDADAIWSYEGAAVTPSSAAPLGDIDGDGTPEFLLVYDWDRREYWNGGSLIAVTAPL